MASKAEKELRLFVTSAKPEYESVLEGDYGYERDEVKLLGLPRYDLLRSEAQKIIAFLPTWRKNIAMKKGVREYENIPHTLKTPHTFIFIIVLSMIPDCWKL